MKKENKKIVKKTLYIVGSLAIAAGAVIAMPKIIDYLSDKMYNPNLPEDTEDDDWGPEIVKREKKEEEKLEGEE